MVVGFEVWWNSKVNQDWIRVISVPLLIQFAYEKLVVRQRGEIIKNNICLLSKINLKYHSKADEHRGEKVREGNFE